MLGNKGHGSVLQRLDTVLRNSVAAYEKYGSDAEQASQSKERN